MPANPKKRRSPTIYPINRDMLKTWFIEYMGEDGRKKKAYGRMNHCSSLTERVAAADKLMVSLTQPEPFPVIEGNQLIKDLWEMFELRREGFLN